MAAMLVLGVVVGGVATGVAAPAADNGSSPIAATAGQQGFGLRLGGAMRDAGARLADIVARDDPAGLANRNELQQWRQLEAIGNRLARLHPSPQTDALRDKQQRLHGILAWQLNTDYKPRLQHSRQQLAELDALSAESRQILQNLQQADLDTPARFAEFSRRIQQQRATLLQLQTRTASTRLAQGDRIEQLAVTELEEQQQRLDSYIVQARFALAQTYDDARQNNTGAIP